MKRGQSVLWINTVSMAQVTRRYSVHVLNVDVDLNFCGSLLLMLILFLGFVWK
jgi:hypothetical protein